MEKIYAFIINRDLLTWPKNMVEWMYSTEIVQPVIVDNNSSYQPLLEWYSTGPCPIVSVPQNLGHLVLHYTGLLSQVPGDYYIISDPDLDLSNIPKDGVLKLKEVLDGHPEIFKAGFALRIDDLPEDYPVKSNTIGWETKYWQNSPEEDCYYADIDTTFALYDKRRGLHHDYNAIRVAGKYSAKHLPWYITPSTINDEIVYYLENSDKQFSSIAREMDELIQNYKKR